MTSVSFLALVAKLLGWTRHLLDYLALVTKLTCKVMRLGSVELYYES